MSSKYRDRCLILACGNPLRGDDGAAWHIAEAAYEVGFPPSVRIIFQQQWTPDLAEDIARAEGVLFVDCALTAPPGSVSIAPIAPAFERPPFLTHHQDPATLLALSFLYYDHLPRRSDLLLIGAESINHTEKLSPPVQAAVPRALALIKQWVNS